MASVTCAFPSLANCIVYRPSANHGVDVRNHQYPALYNIIFVGVLPVNPPKCNDLTYIDFLIAASTVFSCTEAARCHSSLVNALSHDCFTRLLQNQSPDTESLWAEVRKFVTPKESCLIVDNTVLDKPYSEKMGFVRYRWSGKHHRTVKGIGLITLVWTNGTTVIPIDFRIYNIDEDDKTKNDHFLDMLDKAKERGFNPEFVLWCQKVSGKKGRGTKSTYNALIKSFPQTIITEN
ncbi:hypothetical protein EO95_18405 [Methanosarcina sp. 1.H.T.1A.1]|nr:hypothetical protein EO95_18405 [Methanosarcina sp. 1.H.T.1A.1]